MDPGSAAHRGACARAARSADPSALRSIRGTHSHPEVVMFFFRSLGRDADKINPAMRGSPPTSARACRASLLRVFVVVFGGGDAVGIRQPAVQVDVPAAFGTK